ncbi:MAG: hypothetical protein P1P78_09920 [Methyloprofundus sp.]|nr:hypothetical protein [Methyloprofundus sp.]
MNRIEIDIVESEDDIQWANGWGFFKSAESSPNLLPMKTHCMEWVKGFLTAMADYDIEPYREYDSIQAALLGKGISGNLLEICLFSVEMIFNDDEWCRFPSVPIRN